MRSKLKACLALLVPVAVVCVPAGASAAPGHRTEVEFNSDGVALSPLPARVKAGTTLRVRVGDVAEGRVLRTKVFLDLVLEALKGIAAEKQDAGAGTPFGLDGGDLEVVRKALCGEGWVLSEGPALATFRARLVDAGCRDTDPRDPSLVPPLHTFLDPAFELVHECADREGRALARTVTAAPAGPGPWVIDVPIPATCHRLAYELRRSNRLADVLATWPPAGSEPRAKVVKAARIAAAGLKEHRLEKHVESLRSLRDDARKALDALEVGTVPENLDLTVRQAEAATPAVKGLQGAADPLVAALSEASREAHWARAWLWLTGGHPAIDPLVSQRAALGAQQDALRVLEAEVATLEGATKGMVLSSFGDNALTALQKVAARRAERDKMAEAVKKTAAAVAQSEEVSKGDVFLYSGLLFVRTGRLRPTLRHHDARNQYVSFDRDTPREIDERERLMVLVENEQPGTKLKLGVTITPIALDTSLLAGELKLSDVLQIGGGVLVAREAVGTSVCEPARPPELTPKDDAAPEEEARLDTQWALKRAELMRPCQTHVLRVFVAEYDALDRTVALLKVQAQAPELFIPRPDETPTLVTLLLPHDPPPTAPSDASYEIKNAEGTTVLGKGQYRFNKLYYVRFRAGWLYSDLRKTDVTITPGKDGSPDSIKVEEAPHGLDATAGVQIYPLRRSIRKVSWSALIPVLYTGFSVRKPLENLYLGAGFEPIPGLTLMGGLHRGKEERLIQADGQPPRIEGNWSNGKFFSMTLDVDLFKRMFNPAGIF
jgi:hypothetical protein